MDGTNLPLLGGGPDCTRDGWETRKNRKEEAAKFITSQAPSRVLGRSSHSRSLTGRCDSWLAGALGGDRDQLIVDVAIEDNIMWTSC